MQITRKRTTLIYFNSLVKEIMTRKSAAAFFPYSQFNQCKRFNVLEKVRKVFFFLVMMFLNVWLTNVYNKQSNTITTGKARIVVKDKPS